MTRTLKTSWFTLPSLSVICCNISKVPGWLIRLSIGLLFSAQVMILWFSSLSPKLGSTLAVQSLLGILSPALPLPYTHTRVFSLSHPPSLPLPLSLQVNKKTLKERKGGRLGGSVGWASNFSTGHGLTVCEFEPHVGLCANKQLRAWRLLQILYLSLPLPCSCSASLCVSTINKC